jgi:hypothetical protein
MRVFPAGIEPATFRAVDSSHQLSGYGRAEIPARLGVGLGRLAHHHDRLSDFHPAQPGRDGRDTPVGSFGALVAVQPRPERPAPCRVEKLVIRLVERKLERTADNDRGPASANTCSACPNFVLRHSIIGKYALDV